MLTPLRIEFASRKSQVLSSSSLACLSGVASINLTSSCAHRCVYCYACGYSSHPGQGTVVVYSQLYEKLLDEWKRKRKKPETVYFSPSSDLFQPIPEVLQTGYGIISFVLKEGVNVAFVSKGVIPESHFELLRKYPKQLQAQIGLVSTDEGVISMFEPGAASAGTRIEQIRRLTQAGIRTTVRLAPILPGVTDDEETFAEICTKISAAGVKTIAASVLFLRPAIKESLRRNLRDPEILDRLLDRFSGAKRLAIHADRSCVWGLPREERETIFKRLHGVASHFGIEIHICGCMNPDVSPDLFSRNCRISGVWCHEKPGQGMFDFG